MKYLVIRKWHEKIGVYIALFVVFLAISGIALNHTEKFKLNTTYVKLDWLLDLYQINPESEPIGYFSCEYVHNFVNSLGTFEFRTSINPNASTLKVDESERGEGAIYGPPSLFLQSLVSQGHYTCLLANF